MEDFLRHCEIAANLRVKPQQLSLMKRIELSFKKRNKLLDSEKLSWDKKRDIALGFYTAWANTIIYSINIEGINSTIDPNYITFKDLANRLSQKTSYKTESNYLCGNVE